MTLAELKALRDGLQAAQYDPVQRSQFEDQSQTIFGPDAIAKKLRSLDAEIATAEASAAGGNAGYATAVFDDGDECGSWSRNL